MAPKISMVFLSVKIRSYLKGMRSAQNLSADIRTTKRDDMTLMTLARQACVTQTGLPPMPQCPHMYRKA